MSRPRLLITGAGGFCGEHACRHFAAEGWEVVAAVRRLPEPGEAEWLNDVRETVRCDLGSRYETERLLERAKPDYVLHLAGMNAVGPSWSDPAAVMESNVMGTIHLLEAVRRVSGIGGGGLRPAAGVPAPGASGNAGGNDAAATAGSVPTARPASGVRVVVAGSMLRFPLPAPGCRPAPPHPYSLSKTVQVLAAQSWATLYGMDIIVAEPSNLIGPGRSTGLCALIARYAAAAERADAGVKPFRLSSRTERRDLLDVRDAIRAYAVLLERGERGHVYPVASGVMRTLGELADCFDRQSLRPLAWEVGQSDAPSPEPADVSAIIALGWRPLFSLERSLGDALDYARQFKETIDRRA